jgi:hypothetical protein
VFSFSGYSSPIEDVKIDKLCVATRWQGFVYHVSVYVNQKDC